MKEAVVRMVERLSEIGWVRTFNYDRKTVIVKAEKIDFDELRRVLGDVDLIGVIERTVITGDDEGVRIVITLRR